MYKQLFLVAIAGSMLGIAGTALAADDGSYSNSSNGSTAGNSETPFAKRVIVHGGLQSMPVDHNNLQSPFYHETQRQFDTAQDFAAGGADTLVLPVRSRSLNDAAPLYVAIEDASKKRVTVEHSHPALLTTRTRTRWKIPSADFSSVNLDRVKTIYIGIDAPAGSQADGMGRVYVDDVGLTKPAAAQ